jgi:hypothetical protein
LDHLSVARNDSGDLSEVISLMLVAKNLQKIEMVEKVLLNVRVEVGNGK